MRSIERKGEEIGDWRGEGSRGSGERSEEGGGPTIGKRQCWWEFPSFTFPCKATINLNC